MKQKDAVEKGFFDLDDVFADIVNVFITEGKYIVKPEDLETVHPSSYFEDAEGNTRYQERDVSKIIKGKQMVNLALVGLEPMNYQDEDMPLRVYSYNGAGYYYQLKRRREAKKDNEPVPPVYPVITLVLNFSGKKWMKPDTLQKCFKDDTAGINQMAGDLQLYVVDVTDLSEETILKLQSDFRHVAAMYKGLEDPYAALVDTGNITHIEEFAKLMGVLMEDGNVERWILRIYNKGEGGTYMHEIYRNFRETLYNDGKEAGLSEGRAEGISKGEDNGIVTSLVNLMSTTGMDLDTAMDTLKVPADKREEYALRVKEQVKN